MSIDDIQEQVVLTDEYSDDDVVQYYGTGEPTLPSIYD